MLYNDFFPLSHGKPMELANFKNIHMYLSHTRFVNSFPRKIKHTNCNNWGVYCLTNFCEKFLSLGVALLAVLFLPLDYSMLLNHWTCVHWDNGVMVTWIMIRCTTPVYFFPEEVMKDVKKLSTSETFFQLCPQSSAVDQRLLPLCPHPQ